MKKILTILFVIVLSTITLAQKYEVSELFVLSWGNENNQQLPYAIDEMGGFWGPTLQFVDINENIYLAYPSKDFRKFDPSGNLLFRKEISILKFAVDDSEHVYYTKLDPDQMHIIRMLDTNGTEIEKNYSFSIDNSSQNISWMKNRNGQIVFGNYRETAEIKNAVISSIDRQKKNPVDSKGNYYQSETAVRKSNRTSKISFRQKYINILIDKVVNNEIVRLDTISLNICRYPHECADVFQVDLEDNIYIRLYYDKDLPVDIVVLDSTFKEIDRIELIPPSQLMGLGARPFIRPDGTIYEFRDLDDGLHVIRWSREE